MLGKNSKTGGRVTTSKIIFQSDNDGDINGDDVMDADAGVEFNSEYNKTRKALEGELNTCPRCAPKELLCLIDKHSKHRKVMAEMLRAWVLALVFILNF